MNLKPHHMVRQRIRLRLDPAEPSDPQINPGCVVRMLLTSAVCEFYEAHACAFSAPFALQPPIRLHQVLFWEVLTLHLSQLFGETADERTQKFFPLPRDLQNMTFDAYWWRSPSHTCTSLSLSLSCPGLPPAHTFMQRRCSKCSDTVSTLVLIKLSKQEVLMSSPPFCGYSDNTLTSFNAGSQQFCSSRMGLQQTWRHLSETWEHDGCSVIPSLDPLTFV